MIARIERRPQISEFFGRGIDGLLVVQNERRQIVVQDRLELLIKRGALGAVAFSGSIPDSLDDGEAGAGFPIEVFNVLGAGDGFMSGLLKGWLDGEEWPTALKYAHACGGFAVSRHGCTPAYPSWEELQFFFARGVIRKDLRNDTELEQVHWADQSGW